MPDEIVWQYGPDSTSNVVLQCLKLAVGHARLGLTEKYTWVDETVLSDTKKNRKRLERQAELNRHNGYYSRIILRENTTAVEMEYFIEHTD